MTIDELLPNEDASLLFSWTDTAARYLLGLKYWLVYIYNLHFYRNIYWIRQNFYSQRKGYHSREKLLTWDSPKKEINRFWDRKNTSTSRSNKLEVVLGRSVFFRQNHLKILFTKIFTEGQVVLFRKYILYSTYLIMTTCKIYKFNTS